MVNGQLTQPTPAAEKNPWESGFTGRGRLPPRASVARFRIVDEGEFQLHTAIMMKMKESISLGGRAA
jgi:hypothetical protein